MAIREEPDPDHAGVGTISFQLNMYVPPACYFNVYMIDILTKIQDAFLQTSWLERLAVAFGIVQVLLSSRNKISHYFFGILSIVLTISVLYSARLYAEIILNMYYLLMSFYGLWYWKFRNRAQAEIAISTCTKQEWINVSTIVLLGYFALFGFLKYFTDSDVPMLDAIVSSTAWAGMWLLAKRKLENWILLNSSNAIAIPLLYSKNLYLFAALTSFLFVVAIFGYFRWRKIMITTSSSTSYA